MLTFSKMPFLRLTACINCNGSGRRTLGANCWNSITTMKRASGNHEYNNRFGKKEIIATSSERFLRTYKYILFSIHVVHVYRFEIMILKFGHSRCVLMGFGYVTCRLKGGRKVSSQIRGPERSWSERAASSPTLPSMFT